MHLSGADAGLDRAGRRRRLSASCRRPAIIRDQVGVLIWNARSIVQRVLRNRQPELIPDVSQDPDYVPYTSDTRAQMTLPLLAHEQFIGVLNLESYQIDRFTPWRLSSSSSCWRCGSRSPSATRSCTRARSAAGRLKARCAESARILNETLDIGEVMTRIMAQIQEVVPCDTGSIQQLRDDRLEDHRLSWLPKSAGSRRPGIYHRG